MSVAIVRISVLEGKAGIANPEGRPTLRLLLAVAEEVVRVCGAGQPGSAHEALAAMRAGLAFLAGMKPAALTAGELADCLLELERAESARVAARSSVLAAFETAQVFAQDGQGGTRSWLRWQARVTGAAAASAVAWSQRLDAHPAVRDALAAADVSVSWAREICGWTDLLPASARGNADVILLAAAAAGAGLRDLAALAEELRARTASPDQDGSDDGFEDRSVRLDLHFRGAGRLRGDLTPRCSAALQAVLDALGAKAGPEDNRTIPQRQHDALEEACRRLLGSGCLPDRAGQPAKIWLHMTLSDLLGHAPAGGGAPAGQPGPDGGAIPGGGTIGGGGTAARPAGSAGPQAPLPGPAAQPGDLCDASIMPVVTGHLDHQLLDQLAADLLGRTDGTAGARLGLAYARDLIARNAVVLLSGPEGLAARLRAATLAGPAASISLPLDIGAGTETIPPHLRRAVTLRDRHCAFPGCEQPPPACQVHHLIPVSDGGPTRLDNLVLCCPFHHLIAIHQWGWQLILNADGTTTAISPERCRILHSHGPPATAA